MTLDALLHRLETVASRRLARACSHELNNLLTALTGYNEMARLEATPEVDFYLSCIGEVCQRLKAYSLSLAAYGERPGAYQVPFEPGYYLQQVAEEFPGLRVVGTAGLPEIQSCPHQLQESVRELCRNALAAGSPATALVLEARVSFRSNGRLGRVDARPGDYFELSLTDAGGGFERNWTGRMCEPHQRDRSRPGRGLGLPAVSGFAGSQGGWLEVSSVLGGGSAVTLCLPLEPLHPEEGRVLILVDPQEERGCRLRVLMDSAGAETILVRAPEEVRHWQGLYPAARVVEAASLGLAVGPSLGEMVEAIRPLLSGPEHAVQQKAGQQTERQAKLCDGLEGKAVPVEQKEHARHE